MHEWVLLTLFIWENPVQNVGLETSYFDGGLLVFFLVPSGK
jgi:hypothetical protein